MTGLLTAQVPVFDLGVDSSSVPIPPTPGALDITNFNSAADVFNPDGFNYFIDNGGGLNSPGETFTAPNITNLVLQSLAIDMGLNTGGNGTGPQALTLIIFSVSGTTATPIATYYSASSFAFTAGDWLQWSNLGVRLNPNGVYAYTLSRGASGQGWCQLYLGGGNTYTNGQACEIQAAGGAGAVTYGTSGLYDGNFDIGLGVSAAPATTPPTPSIAGSIYAGSPVTLSELAAGPGQLTYQWQTDNGSGVTPLANINGATSTNVVVTPASAGTYAYDVVVANSVGSVTSLVVNLTVLAPSAPLLTADITPGTNINAFANGTVSLNATFNGTQPITYQWLGNTNGSSLGIAGATSNTLVLSNLQLSASGIYDLTTHNSIGNLNSSAAVLTVQPDPAAPTTAQPYAYAVLTNHPVAYWRLNETNDTLYSASQAYDYSGNNLNATYGNGTTDGQPGPQSPDFPGFEANNNSVLMINASPNATVVVPDLNLNTNTVTVTAWINPNGIIAKNTGLLMWRGNGGEAAGFDFGGQLSGSVAGLGYTWNTNSANSYNYNSGLFAPLGQWSFVAMTITPTNTTLYLYYVGNGATNLLKAVQVVTNGPEAFSGGKIWIGGDNYDNGRTFNGNIDEVAVFNRSLSESQVQSLFLTALGSTGAAPTIGTQPASVSTYNNLPISFSASGGGAPDPTYQWQSGPTASGPWSNISNGGRFSGATSSTLTISNTLAADAIYYQVVLANSSGSVTSNPAQLTLTIVPTGQWTANYAVINSDNGGPDVPYVGRGVLGTGTYWNALPGYPAASVPPAYLDDGATPTPVQVFVSNPSGEYTGPTPYGIELLYPYVSANLANNTTVTFTNVPNGTYNLALYGIDAGYNDRAVQFTVNGVSQSLINVQGLVFTPGDNTALFSGVTITGGALVVGVVPVDSPAHPGNNEGEFNGAQLQLIQGTSNPANIAKVVASGGNIVISGTSLDAGASYRILTTTNLLSPNWVPVATNSFGANGGFTNSLPILPGQPQRFYRVVEP